jgi:hypothetical protein
MVSRRLIVGGAVFVVLVGAAALFVGCGGFAVQPISFAEPVELRDPIELADKPILLDALRIDQTVPISINQPVPIALTGPISISLTGPKVEYAGTYVSESLMERVQIGHTTDEWILAVIGEPDTRHEMSDGSVIWKWVYRPTATMPSLITLPGTEGRPDPQPITAYVRMRDGIVIDKWRG